MMRSLVALVLALTAASAVLAVPAIAQPDLSSVPQNPRVQIEYNPPSYYEPRHILLYQRMKERKVLEEYAQFLSPLKLKDDLKISLESCGVMNSWYNARDTKANLPPTIQICWEWLDMIENGAAVPHELLPPDLQKSEGTGLMKGITRAEVILGGVVDVLVHETGHAVFDIQGVPRLGREEDAADQMSGFMVLQFGNDLARTMVKGALDVNNHLDKMGNFNSKQLADSHALDIQRLWNGVCLAYGKDQAAFADLAKLAGVPADRLPNCKAEYEQVARAFNLTVMPDVDKELMAKVQAMPILRPEDLKLQMLGTGQ